MRCIGSEIVTISFMRRIEGDTISLPKLEHGLDRKISDHLSAIGSSKNNKQRRLELCQVGKMLCTYIPTLKSR
jgi:hypothetical protein